MFNYRSVILLRSVCIFFVLSFPYSGISSVVGIYGVGKDTPELTEYSIQRVFVSARQELVASQVAAGREVYLSLNAFGGSGAWQKFPDSRPVTADGSYLEKSLGGICPTHRGYRDERLALLETWLKDGEKEWQIDGVWLDFIRYPGRWEQVEPNLPDTCYCERCLKDFQEKSGIKIPENLATVGQKADWIHDTKHLEWINWKKEQIVSFVREVKSLIDTLGAGRNLKLGVFLVPWQKADHSSMLSSHLAQDAGLLAPYVDVFSPMVYHAMVGQPAQWIGVISDYFGEMTGKTVWPIIQSHDISAEDFGKAIDAVSHSNADGLLVYSFRGMQEEHWPELGKYKLKQNLIQNPSLLINRNDERPEAWTTPPIDKIYDSKFFVEAQKIGLGNAVGIEAGRDQQGVWTGKADVCLPGKQYLFSAEFLRANRHAGSGYPEVVIWGKKYKLNTHRMFGKYQKLKQLVLCPLEGQEGSTSFEFKNNSSGDTFWMRNPELTLWSPPETRSSSVELTDNNFFPIGAYGARAHNLSELKTLGLNSAVVGLTKENLQTCLELGMRCTLAVPRDPEKLVVALDTNEGLIKKGKFYFYVNDEPGIHSFPEGKVADINRIIKERFPRTPTNMAIVRPQAIPFYEQGADYFMLDQYPVPNMPMNWLSDSMDTAAGYVGRDRLQSVIQAFGDEKHAASGWPRLPSFEEMNCLAFLSVIHGSRGIYFYTYSSISGTEKGRKDFAQVIRRLNSVRSWLVVKNDDAPVPVTMLSKYAYDPAGQPGVHCTSKERYGTKMLLCVNTLRTYTEARVTVPDGSGTKWQDYFGDGLYYTKEDQLRLKFEPFEVRVLLEVSR